jgi:hypothetical protein
MIRLRSHSLGEDAMSRRTETDLIERVIDHAAVRPDRVDALKRLVRKRLAEPVAKRPPRSSATDPWDDYLWDNVPV